MKTQYKFFYFIVLTGIVLALHTSCSDDEEYGNPRLFKPTDLSLTTNYDGFNARWKFTYGAEGYKIEASLTEDFETIDAVAETDAATLFTTVSGLQESQKYYVRLQGTRTDPTLNSKYIYGEVTTGNAYSIFYPVNTDSVSYSAAVLTWRDAVEADKIHIENTSDGTTFTQDVTAANNSRKKITITGLKDGNTYKVTLYGGEKSYGYTLVALPKKPDGLITVSIAEKDNLQTILDNAAEGATILFTGTDLFDYSSTDIYLSKSVTLMGEPGVPKPKLYVKSLLIGGRTAAASASVGNVKLERIEFSGYKLSGTSERTSDEPNACLVSFELGQTPDVSLATLIVDNCIIRNYANSFLELNDKLKEAGTRVRIGEINVNNCIVFDMGRNKMNYPSFISITNKNDKNGYCKKYVISNTTFHHLMRGIIEARVFDTIDGYTNPDIQVNNCTFDHMGIMDMGTGLWYGGNTEATKNVFDFKPSSVDTDIKVTLNNCIWGELSSEKLSATFFQGCTGVVNNSYMLDASKLQITGGTTFFLSIAGSINELFPKRDLFDYTVGTSGEEKNAGDPRWR